MDRRSFLRTSVLSAVASAATRHAPAAEPRPRRPNIVLFLADDMGFSDLGCQGSEIETPHLDRLAKQGLQFSSFYSSPRCCPSRASLLTGMYAHQAHMGMMVSDHTRYGRYPSYEGDLNKGLNTLAEALRPAGYRTLHSGKWHLSAQQTTGPGADTSNWPCQRGFDHAYAMITGAGSYYTPNCLTSDNEPINTFPPGFYFTDSIGDKAVEMIAGGSADQPFFLYCAFNAPHWPLHAPEPVVAKYRDCYRAGWDELRRQRHARQVQSGLLQARWSLTPRDPRVPAWSRASFKTWEAERMAVYAAQVDILDKNVGKIVQHLETAGQLDNTLIFFLTDNGGNYEEFERRALPKGSRRDIWVPAAAPDGGDLQFGNDPEVMPGPGRTIQSYGGPWGNVSNTPFRLYKHFAHEGGIASPLLVHWPAGMQTRPGLSHQLAHEFDIMPTCLEAAGTPLPTSTRAGTPQPPLEGKSLLPTLRAQPVPDRGRIFWEHEGNCAVRDGRWKLVSAFPDTWELYDMEADRTELHNLADSMPEQVAVLAAAYREWAARVGALPWPLPETPPGEVGGSLPLPPYLRHDRW